jgi:hypothetical protein
LGLTVQYTSRDEYSVGIGDLIVQQFV